MSQQPKSRSARYHIFMLSLWGAAGSVPGGPTGWRISLEHGATGERHGFKSLAELMAHLEVWTQSPPAASFPSLPIYQSTGGDHIMERRIINPWTWQDEFGYVQANEVSGVQRTLYCSGQAANDATGAAALAGDMRGQIGLALDNLEAVLSAAGFTFADIVRLNIYVTDVDQFFAHYDAFIGRLAAAGCRHTGSLIGVARLAFPEMMIEIEATAVA
ncbi:MAG: RidA family protein [Anaerolineae bacterium]